MGFFSSTCAKTHLPVLASPAWAKEAPRLCNIVVVPPLGAPYETEYDGYGLGDPDDFDSLKLVLSSDYRGETYAELAASEPEPNQGYFHSEAFVAALCACPGFASHAAYFDALAEFEAGAETADQALLSDLGLSVNLNNASLIRALQSAADGDLAAAKAAWETAQSPKHFEQVLELGARFDALQKARHLELALAVVAKHQVVAAG